MILPNVKGWPTGVPIISYPTEHLLSWMNTTKWWPISVMATQNPRNGIGSEKNLEKGVDKRKK